MRVIIVIIIMLLFAFGVVGAEERHEIDVEEPLGLSAEDTEEYWIDCKDVSPEIKACQPKRAKISCKKGFKMMPVYRKGLFRFWVRVYDCE